MHNDPNMLILLNVFLFFCPAFSSLLSGASCSSHSSRLKYSEARDILESWKKKTQLPSPIKLLSVCVHNHSDIFIYLCPEVPKAVSHQLSSSSSLSACSAAPRNGSKQVWSFHLNLVSKSLGANLMTLCFSNQRERRCECMPLNNRALCLSRLHRALQISTGNEFSH